MSDSSDTAPKNPVYYLGKFYEVLVPVILIAMLGVLGLAFLGKGGLLPAKIESVANTTTPAPAPAPAPTGQGSAPSPAPAPAPTSLTVADAGTASPGGLDPAQMALGKATYMTCAACHGMDGAGLKAGPALMAPSFLGSANLLGDPEIPLLVVLKGIQKENMDYMGMMAALGAALDDQKLAAVLTYVRNSFGNSASAITTEQAAAARAKFAPLDVPAGVKRAELESTLKGL
jgi:mono/diheme cytochrome c family protein